ncbi:MAG: flagella-like protein FlaI [Candidatus Methanoperedens nitroreducens]|uniref:Flagella-like protein FlaI n=1 Tax=Candidatus Methanoperedens nitratireducens TaxID=1392998 RepID=A0A0P7ZGW2_9EURY|nr:type II/IV secretion system ATPase subunit [Candidatus Methanoperedens sp. BLZ2]KAB2943331.1 MAG: type II/IV secretion system ATPase subunit [Candidatus Methanoperedens sp.]KPQ44135.1 MAG: flagella-like protein FlaI [Candidatus Methanoperedens sp. BLZ1]MBZ0173896.1 type II/IV secretion system ATPase subunit [Candidatus Methanoperedens nitroreducens]MCX9077957.1 type II/IV secretion system ATPase subunit [Candidatus Methanoperedens sp.]
MMNHIRNVICFKKKSRQETDPYSHSKHGDLVLFEIPEGFCKVEQYWINEPYVYIYILTKIQTKETLYYVGEPGLSSFERMLLEKINVNLQDILTEEEALYKDRQKKEKLEEHAIELLYQYSNSLEEQTVYKILYYLNRNFLGYEKIDALLKDPMIEDISCDGVNIPIFLYHRKYGNIKTNIQFDEIDLNSFVIKLCQKGRKHISFGSPLVNATLPDGSRIQATLGHDVTTRGSSFTIRRFKEVPLTPIDLINFNTVSVEQMAYLWLAVENNKSLLIAGGTASGKTSTLNSISLFIPPASKVVTIEDTRELTLYHDNWIAGVTREPFAKGESEINMFDLLISALRQRPEYIIVGEVRGSEARTLFQAMSTGHTTYSTIHAGDIQDVINRLENEPINVPHAMLKALDIITVQIQITIKGKKSRRCQQLVEITGLDPRTGNIRINDMFKWNPQDDCFEKGGESYVMNNIMHEKGWSMDQLLAEIDNRKAVLRYMVKNNIRDYKSFANIIQAYYIDPKDVMAKLEMA